MTPEQLISKWQHAISSHPIPTWTEPATLAYCAEIAAKSRNMVELGTYVGCSAMAMLRANPDLHLWTVDIFTAFAYNEEIAAHFLETYIRRGRCELIKGDSARAAGMLQHLRGNLDAVWVDDGHATADVIRDITSFLPLLRSGGIMFGHDFELPHNNVAIGVLNCLPPDKLEFPVPRVWAYRKP